MDCDMMRRHIIEWEREKPVTARNNVWKYACKYDKCPKNNDSPIPFQRFLDTMKIDEGVEIAGD